MRIALLVACAVLVLPANARALDKQGKAKRDALDGTGLAVSGEAFVAVALYNPTYAARPDNTGLTLFRYATHLDVDLLGPRLSIPFDVSVFTDRQRRGAGVLAPSELDLIGGLTSTWPVGPGHLELGARVEHDRPVDQGTYTQSYADARARFTFDLARSSDAVRDAFSGGDLRGWLTLGWFVWNPTYPARPDNSGLALFRYAAHTEIAPFGPHFALGLDAVLFTPRNEGNAIRPSELDFTPELIARFAPVEVHLAYERDMPVDRRGLVQHFLYLLVAVAFDDRGDSPAKP